MQLNKVFQISMIAGALVLAGCGGDIKVKPTTIDNSIDNSVTNPSTGTPTEVKCASYTQNGSTLTGTADGNDCIYSTTFASDLKEITSDLYIPAIEGRHIFNGSLFIGADYAPGQESNIPATGAVLTIEAGSTLVFSGNDDYLRIARGSRIVAEGTVDKPITFTSNEAFEDLDTVGEGPKYRDWGGIMINGRGINNKCTTAEREADTCSQKTEGAVSYYGGNIEDDNSGILKFVNISYAGSGPKLAGAGDDLNSLSLYAVGSGTTIDYVHIHEGYDDGVEAFGGSVNMKHLVLTHNQDDSVDWDEGYTGKIQHVLIKHGNQLGNRGFETDGAKSSPAAQGDTDESGSNPTVANVTVISNETESIRDGDASRGIMMREWGMGKLYNLLVTNPATEGSHQCFELNDEKDKVESDGVIANANADKIIVEGSVVACGINFKNPKNNPDFDLAAWWKSKGNIALTKDHVVYAADGYRTAATMTDAEGTAVTIPAAIDANAMDPWFDQVDYVGAISESDVDSDWAKWVDAAMAIAAASSFAH
ncbi:hypothetical protein SG34_003100 [Thalassomonas viridans]|uniref:Uncharacterized protein n=1 Tax=Thalassomonas viridans TaxID=137584 RepID=A0AAE9Z440_9GAMM|nr:hypothetical protein [Thalassomonas viridans]WDE05932.1 hypothetical protein SG34_003100 [Thalassomonas viridans]